jgi:hypothetical protein
MNTQITIAKREEKNINGRDIINIYDENGVRFTHFIDPGNEGWEESLQEGETVRVFAIKKHNSKNPKYPYRNIYKPRTEEADDEPVETFEEELRQQSGHVDDTPITAEADKNERIRWMNSLNNACRLIQGQVIEYNPQKPMNSIVQLANVIYKLEPQR